MNECTVDDVEQVSCPHCSETCEYDRGWNEALEAVRTVFIKEYDLIGHGHNYVIPENSVMELLNTLKK